MSFLPWLDPHYSQLVVLLDGAADEPNPLLGGLTPFQAAKMPALRKLIAQTTVGRIATIPDGCQAGSEVANLSILGYAQEAASVEGRAGFEALGIGLHLPPGTVCYRCDLPIYPDSLEIPLSIGLLQKGIAHRHLFVPAMQTGEEAAIKALKQAVERQYGLPRPRLWGRSVIRDLNLEPFIHRHAMSAAMISAVPVMWGIGIALGMKDERVAGATGDIDSDFAAKAHRAICMLEHCQFVYLHIEGPDEASHRCNPYEVRDVLERIDREVITIAADWWQQNDKSGRQRALTILPDHYTSSISGKHLSWPVPYIHLRQGDGRTQPIH
ncbi:MAG: hypothetical protein SPI72_07365 [Porphyromonas sp.]|nr:hypothetical protein [Porphyromonas sp.]